MQEKWRNMLIISGLRLIDFPGLLGFEPDGSVGQQGDGLRVADPLAEGHSFPGQNSTSGFASRGFRIRLTD